MRFNNNLDFTAKIVISKRKKVSLILPIHLKATMIFFAEKGSKVSCCSVFYVLLLREIENLAVAFF